MYLKALIWESIIDSQESDAVNPSVKDEEYSCFTNEELRRRLAEVDPERASALHTNDRRKMIRGIEVTLTWPLSAPRDFPASPPNRPDLQENRPLVHRVEEDAPVQA